MPTPERQLEQASTKFAGIIRQSARSLLIRYTEWVALQDTAGKTPEQLVDAYLTKDN